MDRNRKYGRVESVEWESYLHWNFDNSMPIALVLVYRRLLLVLE